MQGDYHEFEASLNYIISFMVVCVKQRILTPPFTLPIFLNNGFKRNTVFALL